MPTDGSGRGFRNGSSRIYSNSSNNSSFLDCYSVIKSVTKSSLSSPYHHHQQQQHRLVALSSGEPLNYYFTTEQQERLEANSNKYRESQDAVPSASSSTATAATTGTTSTRNSLPVEMQSPWSSSNPTTSSGGGAGGVGVVDTLPHHQPLHNHHQSQSLSLAHLMINDVKGENEDESENDDRNHKDLHHHPDRLSAAPAPRIITTTMIPGRSSLGQFIERSTSAPPPSSSTVHTNASTGAGAGGGGHFFLASSSTAPNHMLKVATSTSNGSTNNSHVFESTNHQQGRDHALLGNDLLELMSRTYPESNRDHGRETSWDSTDKQQQPSMNSFAGRPRGASDAAAYSAQRGGEVVDVPEEEEEEEEADDLAMLLSQGGSNNMNSGRMTAPSFLHSNFILNQSSSSSTNDHRTAGLTLQRPTSASGASNSSSDGGGGGSGLGSSGFGGPSGLAHLGLGNGLVRSQSAAPTLHGSTNLGPPPGLSLNQSDSFVQQAPRAPLPLLTRRSASAGILDANHQQHQQHALRPAAKTLMDLIQEDYPIDPRLSEEESPQNYQFQENLQNGMTNQQSIETQHQEQDEIVHQNGGIRVVQSMQPRQLLHQPQQQLRNEYGYTITQQQPTHYADVQQLDFQHLSPPQQQPHYHHIQQPPPQQYDDGMPTVQQPQYRVVVDYGTGNEMYAASRQQQQQQQQPIYVSPNDQRQYIRASPSPADNQMLRRLESGSSVGSGQAMYKIQGHQQHQVPSASALYTQTQPAQTVQLDPTAQAPQQIYYSSTGQPLQQRNMPCLAAPAHVISHHPHHLAPHQSPSPSGQQQATSQPTTVYLNAQGEQISQPPSGSYGCTTVQYHHAPAPPPQQQQRTQVVHSSIAGGVSGADMTQQQQYVSVVPVPGGPPQVTYWPSEVATVTATGQQGMGPTTVTIMGAPGAGGGPIVARVMQNHVDMTQQQQQQQHQYGVSPQSRGRGGGDKGGRGGRRGPAGGARRGGVDAKHSVHSMSSPLLDEFRATKNRDWTMHQIAGHVVEFCQDQNGSRFIQQRLELGDPAEQQIVVCEVIPAIRRLRNDVFGNYVVQKLLDFGTAQVKSSIRDTLEGEMLQLSLQMYGCRVVQKALEALSEEDIPRLLVEFHHNVLSCIHDQNGNHVIQKCIEVVSNRAKRAQNNGEEARSNGLNEKIDFIINDVLVNTATLSCHPYGCRVLQRILEHCEDWRKTKVLDEIKNCHRKLLDDQYGNYVIQHVLQFGRQVDRDSILHIVVDAGLLGLSRQKFASNVVEKLLKYGNSPQRRAIVREMLKKGDDPTIAQVPAIPSDSNTSVVLLMVRDAYANYVVQTTLDVVPDSEEKTLLLKELNSHSDELVSYKLPQRHSLLDD